MSIPNIDISSLLALPLNADFAAHAYHTLLGRAAGPTELRYAVQMLSDGLTRGGFLYWITRSPEFQNHLSVPDIQRYKKECYLFKGLQKLSDAFHLRRPAKLRPEIHSPVTADNDIGFAADIQPTGAGFDASLETEYCSLANAQMAMIPEAFPEELHHTAFYTVGHLAKDLLPKAAYAVPDTASADASFFSSPEHIYRLLVPSRERRFENLPNTLLFTMPKLPSTQGLSVIWDEHWYGPESDEKNHVLRWSHGDSNRSALYIINHSTSMRKVTLDFTLSTLVIGSEARIFCAGSEIPVIFTATQIPVSLNFWLNPGCNTITFVYCGKRMSPVGTWGHAAQLAVCDLKLPDILTDTAFLYDMDTAVYGTGYYPYLLPDKFIRSRLHQGGFFEVQAYEISSLYTIRKLEETRFLNAAESCHRDCYYTAYRADVPLAEAAAPAASDKLATGIILYAAYKTGSFQTTVGPEVMA